MAREPITVVATFKIRRGAEREFEAAVERHLPPQVDVPGLDRFWVYRDPGDPTRYLFYEDWTSDEAFQANLRTPTHASYLAATKHLWDDERDVGSWERVNIAWETPA